ncbi:Fibronectin type III domain-containing protein [Streptosporangium subroseum]|uniref:Fibronectin type III domain-containing protein n=1 Tax=Streptosporangium subroseum TaxID=106412 RepID=A0A239GFN9_9ACTN|nr:carbohydrate binding domain-containing protein [Streptosporangium subroseum]SNS68017.1 Fibronectin type III domain-containing protein [Streptosporangium subroseum]
MGLRKLVAVAVLALSGTMLVASPAQAANITTNPGFENDLAGWTCTATSGAAIVSSPVHGGTKALQATPAGNDTARCQQTVSVKPSSAYTLSAWVRGGYVFLGATGTGTTDPSTWGTPGASWTQLSRTFTTGASTTSVTIYVNGWYGQGTYQADDLVLDGAAGGGTPPDTTAPTVPANLAVGSPTGSSLSLTWGASTDNSGSIGRYEVSRDNGTPVSAGTSTTYTASGLSAATSYGFRVRACDGAGNCSAYTPSVSGRTNTDTGPPPSGTIRYAPYIDITMTTPSLTGAAAATGVKNYTLAFALGDSSGCNPAWGGTIPINDSRVINDVKALQAQGGQVIVATGGAMGPYLEHVCGTSASLLAAYKKVLDTVGTNHLDVDVEAAIDANKVNTALRQLQAERGTTISYTLRIQGQDYGVDPFSLSILQDAAAKGLNVIVNPMLMNFGYSGNWGDAMIAAAQATLGQMKTVWPSRSDAQLRKLLGLTPMIGKNDTGMTTTQADARKLLTWANANHVAFVGFWSSARDNGGCTGGQVSPTCSGISQSSWEFTNIFKGFTG